MDESQQQSALLSASVGRAADVESGQERRRVMSSDDMLSAATTGNSLPGDAGRRDADPPWWFRLGGGAWSHGDRPWKLWQAAYAIGVWAMSIYTMEYVVTNPRPSVFAVFVSEQ